MGSAADPCDASPAEGPGRWPGDCGSGRGPRRARSAAARPNPGQVRSVGGRRALAYARARRGRPRWRSGRTAEATGDAEGQAEGVTAGWGGERWAGELGVREGRKEKKLGG